MAGSWLQSNVAMVAGWILGVAMFVFALSMLAFVVVGALDDEDSRDD